MKNETLYDIAIIGAGPAGLTATIYCLRDDKKVLLIEKDLWGGQINNSPLVNNIPGFSSIRGVDFTEKMEEQIRSITLGSLTEEYKEVVNIKRAEGGFTVKCDDGSEYSARAVILAMGTKHRLLNVPGEEELIGNGISFCSVCDAPFCVGHDVVVIGGGNSAAVEALECAKFAKHVQMLQNLSTLTAEASLTKIIDEAPHIDVTVDAIVTDFSKNGDKIVTWYTDAKTQEEHSIESDNVFLAIGLIPQNECAASIIGFDKMGYIAESTEDIGVAGDCKNKCVRQVATACGDGAAEAVRILKYLNDLK